MRDRPIIEKDIPKRIDIDDPWALEGHRNTQSLLTLILEVALDVRQLLENQGSKEE